VEPANAEQRAYWNSADSREWVDGPQRYDEMLEPFAHALLDTTAPEPGEIVLDVGCGNGATTLMFAERVAPTGSATGVDLSEPMVANARDRAADRGLGNAVFTVADAQIDDVGGPYDVIVSRFGVMFFDDPLAACVNLVDALAEGGRLTFAVWRSVPENEWVMVQARAAAAHVQLPDLGADGPGPFRYADPAPLVADLERAGLRDVAAEPYDHSMLLGGRGTLDEVMDHVAAGGMLRRFLGDADDGARDRVLASVRDSLAPYETDEGVRIDAAVWLVSGHRR
jgi:SAM-dependent methyltransferase